MKKNDLIIHPGEILKEEFLNPLKLNGADLASAIGVEKRRIYDIINSKRSITAETDILLCTFFGLSIGFWLSIQNRFDIETQLGILPSSRLEKIQKLNVV